MFHKILVALDRSDSSRQIFDTAVALAKQKESQLILLHVLSVEEEGCPGVPISNSLGYSPIPCERILQTYEEAWETLEAEGLAMLRSLTDEATAAGVRTEFMQYCGNPGRIICDVARIQAADLIILGRRGRSGLSELFLGSVSNYVLHHAPCSTFVVHEPVAAQAADKLQQQQVEQVY